MTNRAKITTMASALALAMTLGTTVLAQSTGSGSAGSGASGGSSGSGASGDGGQGGGMTSSSGTFQSWLNEHRSGRISRQAYLDEVARRWDAADRDRQGLTYDEISRTYYSPIGMGGPTTTSPQDKKGIKQ